MNATELKRILAGAGLKPNRALGQNFCVDEVRLAAIADAACVDGLPVLEIGPGLGALTEPLLLRAARVVAVEKDAAMAELLRARLGGAADASTAAKDAVPADIPRARLGGAADASTAAKDAVPADIARARLGGAADASTAAKDAVPADIPRARLEVYTADILRFDIAAAMEGKDFCAVGNLPYYITTPIAERLLSLLPQSMTLMVQREAADRFLAVPGERVYGPVAVLARTYYAVSCVMDVPRSCYYPQPEVDSAVVRLVRRAALPAADPAAFQAFLARAFAMRRKTLFNNLARDARAAAALSTLGLPADARAEALTPGALLAVFGALSQAEA